MSIAFHNFALKQTRDEALRQIGLQHQIRGAVLRAAAALMKRHDLDPGAALGILRSECMRRRLPLETVSALVLDCKWLPGVRVPRRPATGQDWQEGDLWLATNGGADGWPRRRGSLPIKRRGGMTTQDRMTAPAGSGGVSDSSDSGGSGPVIDRRTLIQGAGAAVASAAILTQARPLWAQGKDPVKLGFIED